MLGSALAIISVEDVLLQASWMVVQLSKLTHVLKIP